MPAISYKPLYAVVDLGGGPLAIAPLEPYIIGDKKEWMHW